MKGREWYQTESIAHEYEDKRFSGGGRLIDRREKAAVIDALGPIEDRQLLEIACGTGRFSVMLAERGADVTGIDISEAMLRQSRTKALAAAIEDRLHLLRGDAGRLPFPDKTFDTVFAIRFFHLADTPARFLSEMCRVARDRVVFDTFNAFSARSAYNWLLPMGSRLYTKQEVSRLLDGSGLRLTNATHDFVVPYGIYRELPGEVARALRMADRAILEAPFGDRLASVTYWSAEVE